MATLPSFSCFQQPGTGLDTSNRCRLLDLPAELRLRIWEYTLAPTGTIALSRTKTKRFATTPILGPTLLATCRQIHSEAAAILYSENCLYLKVDAHDNCWPTISKSRLPQRVLQKLQHMSVNLDCTGYMWTSYADVDWTAFTALVSLQTLRIAVTAQARYARDVGQPSHEYLSGKTQELLREVLERVPKSTKVVYGKEDESPKRKTPHQPVKLPEPGLVGESEPCEIDGTALTELAAEMTEWMEQGCKSGSVRNVFAEEVVYN